MNEINNQYGPPIKVSEWKFLESYFKRRIHHESYRDKKHNLYKFDSNRIKIIGMLEYELSIVQSELKRRVNDE